MARLVCRRRTGHRSTIFTPRERQLVTFFKISKRSCCRSLPYNSLEYFCLFIIQNVIKGSPPGTVALGMVLIRPSDPSPLDTKEIILG